MFRNICLLRLASAWPEEQALHEALAAAAFSPCEALSELSAGWEAPVDGETPSMCRSVAGADLIQLRTQSRILPAAAVNDAVEVRIREYRERVGEPPRRAEQRRLKAQTRDKLLPRALLRSQRTRGLMLRSERVLAIDAVTPARVERFVDSLKRALGQLEVTELPFRRPFAELLQRVLLGDAPGGIGLGQECRMHDVADGKASVRFAAMDLADASVRRHLRDGMTITHLGIELPQALSGVLDHNGRLSRVAIAGTDLPDEDIQDDPHARADADIVLLAAALRSYLRVMAGALGKVD